MRANRSIEVDLGEVKEPRTTLADITAIAALCPFQPMIEACLGTTCRTPETALPRAFVRLGEPHL